MTTPADGAGMRAQALLDAGQPQRAREAALHALASNPQDTEARWTLARALVELDQTEPALTQLRAILAEQPENADALRLFAFTTLDTNKPKRGLAAANEALRLQPSAWQSHLAVALAEARVNGRAGSERAIAAAQRSIELAPTIATPHFGLGQVYLLLKRNRDAERSLRVALSISPNDPDVLQNLGVALERQGKAAAAMNLFADLAGSQPGARIHVQNLSATFKRWVGITLFASLAWVGFALRWPAQSLVSNPADEDARTIYLALVTLLPVAAAVASLTLIVRFRHNRRSLAVVLRREAPHYIAIATLLAGAYVLLIAAPLLPAAAFTFTLLGGIAVLIVGVPICFAGIRRDTPAKTPPGDGHPRVPSHATPRPSGNPDASPLNGEPRLSSLTDQLLFDQFEEEQPLTFGEDLVRAAQGKPAPTGPDGKPLIQPWAVGPGRTIGLIAAIVGLLAAFVSAIFGIVLGVSGFLLSNTAWAHLRNAGRPRALPLAGQIIGAVAVVQSIASLIIGAVSGG